jgi:hypothetical protein
MYKLPGIDKITLKLIRAEGETLQSEIHKLINSLSNKEEFPEQWKESIIMLIYKKGDKTDCSNYQTISVLSTSYKISSCIFLSRLSPYVAEITLAHQCRF